MPSKFDPKKHHRRSIRLAGYDYSQPGAYYVTSVTWHRECLFGEVMNGEMKLNKYGLVAKQQLEKLSKRFPNAELGAFVIMPNHIHVIIIITDGRGTAAALKDLEGEPSRRAPAQEGFQKPVKGSIPTIIRSHKSAVAYRINLTRKRGAFAFGREIITNLIKIADEPNEIAGRNLSICFPL